MNQEITENKSSKLFILLGSLFIANALIAEFIGVKIFSLEKTIGIEPFELSILGFSNLSFNLTTGVLLWPFVFILTDIINEYFGIKGVKLLSIIAAGLISYAFIIFFLGIKTVPANFWISSNIQKGVPDMNVAFSVIFGQGLWIIIGSLFAFLLGQLLDVSIFQKLKKITGEKKIWLRATGSTLVSQLLDSFVVLFIAFYIGAQWSLKLVFAIGIVNYIYKFIIAILMTPIIYLSHSIIDKYLGKEVAQILKNNAQLNNK